MSRHQGCGRFIPAGAGNTSVYCGSSVCCPVHPRGRGEHDANKGVYRSASGSSPRARGTPDWRLLVGVCVRFIPAGAGNTTESPPRKANSAVHPRGRGEHMTMPHAFPYVTGSSPRARGTRAEGPRARGQARFIPAGAGNTRQRRHRLSEDAVHPRGRGEHWTHLCIAGALTGSSPRARGTRVRVALLTPEHRFIPAGAGNTHGWCDRGAAWAVHPRGRGEHALTGLGSAWDAGSSPRARGTRWPGGSG